MSDKLTELRDQTGLALSAKRYNDVISIYKIYLQTSNDIPPIDRQMLYFAYEKLLLDQHYKSYWKLTMIPLSKTADLDYLKTIENDIDHLCKEIVRLIDDYFLASKSNKDLDIVMTLRQRGDFLFFHSSIARPATKQILLQSALRSYTEGMISKLIFRTLEILLLLGVERSRLTLSITEPERVLIQLRKCSCEVQLSYGRCHSSTYGELINAIEEMKISNSSEDNSLLNQMETYRLELDKLRC